MILKLRTKSENDIGWKIIDNIALVDYKYFKEPENFNKGEYKNRYINNFPSLKGKRIVEINVFYRNQSELTIYTDDMAYILNDDGKTCEKINF